MVINQKVIPQDILRAKFFSDKIKKYTNKQTYEFRDKKMSFGMFISTIPF